MTSGPQPRADHYSYSVYADRAMAESFERQRFSGPIGRLLAETQPQQEIVEYVNWCEKSHTGIFIRNEFLPQRRKDAK